MEKTYYKAPETRFYRYKLNKSATPFSKRIPLEQAIKTAIAWDMPYDFIEIKEKASKGHQVLLERLFTRSQTVDWITCVIGIQGLKKWFETYRDIVREDLKLEILSILR